MKFVTRADLLKGKTMFQKILEVLFTWFLKIFLSFILLKINREKCFVVEVCFVSDIGKAYK